jgi:hypothetical protein
MPVAIRCQVVEVPANAGWQSRREQPRDLLPWADPYIAVLMDRLEERYAAADEEHWSPPADYDWQDDAFRPDQPASARLNWDAPVFGGWPLLDDVK